MDTHCKNLRLIAKPKSFSTIHDIPFLNDNIYIIELRRRSIDTLTKNKNIQHHKLPNKNYLIRENAKSNNGFFAGFTLDQKS